MGENVTKVKARAKVDICVNEDWEHLIAKKGEVVTLEHFTPYMDDEKPHVAMRMWNARRADIYWLHRGSIAYSFADLDTAMEYNLPIFDEHFEILKDMKLTAENVQGLFNGCLAHADTPIDVRQDVEGVKHRTTFDQRKLQENAELISQLCNQLPDKFKKDNGGGWSFLNMCVDKDGNQWTGFHEVVDKLLMLGIAIGKMSFLLPKQMWSILPGGMPYVVVND